MYVRSCTPGCRGAALSLHAASCSLILHLLLIHSPLEVLWIWLRLEGSVLLLYSVMFARRLTLSLRVPTAQAASFPTNRAKQVKPALFFGAGAVCITLYLTNSNADCAAKGKEAKKEDTKKAVPAPPAIPTPNGSAGDGQNDPVARAIKAAAPLMAKLGFGGVLGYCSGYALRTVGKMAAVAIGVSFCGLQYLQYKGYIKIDYGAVEKVAEKSLDMDGDGKFDSSDLLIMWASVKTVLMHGLPSAAGFLPGFVIGFRG